ncbi:MAG TPA: zinc-binding dehydrogenase, partial [Acidimicrobiales bacterium]
PANHILLKNYAVVGVHWGAYNAHDPELVHRCHAELMRLHAEGQIAPLVQRLVPFEEAPDAIAALASRGTWGKLVVTPPAAR